MKDDYVTYQQAVKLKKLGFDWECCDCFVEGVIAQAQLQHYVNPVKWNSAKIGGSKYPLTHISAPSITLAAKWLREIYMVHILVGYSLFNKQWYCDLLALDESVDIPEKYIDPYDYCPTYEMALSDGISNVLEILTGIPETIHIDLTPFVKMLKDQELRDELKRHTTERKATNIVLRCRDCKHCGEGCCHKSSRYKTSVCFLKPKPQVGPDRYYATLHSRKACENFEPK